MSKQQTPITAEEYFNKEYGKGHFQVVFDLNDFVSLFGLIDEFAEYRERRAVLEALEEEILEVFLYLENTHTERRRETAIRNAKEYYNEVIKPKYLK